MKKKRKTAFTLAEVLITLTIIGVVSALTVPVLNTQQKDKELVTRYKKTYSAMSQALNKTIMLDFGGNINCHYPINDGGTPVYKDMSECHEFYKAFTKNLNIIKTCEGNAKNGGCVPDYGNFAPSGGGCTGFSKNSIENLNYAYVIGDGQILLPYGAAAGEHSEHALFAIDINGMKGPNKPGYDFTTFTLYRRSSDGAYLFEPGSVCDLVSSGGRTSKAMWQHAFGGKE